MIWNHTILFPLGPRYLFFLMVMLYKLSLSSQNPSNFVSLPFSIDNQNVKVTHSVQDDLGYVWLSHTSGLSRYDGYGFKFISSDQIFGETSPSEEVKKVFKDGRGVIWVLSLSGKISFIQKNGTFSPLNDYIPGFSDTYPIETVYPDGNRILMATKRGSVYSYDPTSRSMDSITTIPINGHGRYGITSMVRSRSQQLVLSTHRGPVYIYDLEVNRLRILDIPYNSELSDNTLLLLDKLDRLWIGSSYIGHPILVYDLLEKSFVQDTIFKNRDIKHLEELFTVMYCDVEGMIWLGTDGNGLYRVDPHTGESEIFKRNDLNRFSLSTNTIIDINEDLKNNLWILTNYGNINILRKTDNPIYYNPGTINLKPARILSSFRASDGTLWVGTDGEGLSRFSPTGVPQQFFKNTDQQKGFYIHYINEDKDKNIWVGTYKDGLWIYRNDTRTFEKVDLRNREGHRILDIRYIYRDTMDRMWVTSDHGIFVYKDRNTLLSKFENYKNGLVGGISQCVVEDVSGTIWLAYNGGGLFKFKESKIDFSKSSFIQFTNLDDEQLTNRNNDIISMASMGEAIIWMVTVDGRLSKFDIENHRFLSVSIDDPENPPVFRSVLMEDKDNLWLGSTNGIWHYNPKNGTFKVFREQDGLQDNFFMQRSVHKGSDGFFYFGGLNGLNYFKPSTITKNVGLAELFIEEVEILNRPAIELVPDQIKEGVEKLETLALNYDQSSFSFRFLAMNNIFYPHYNYAYRLKGFNDIWINAGKERLATYTNIPPGDYVFEVRAGSRMGKWDIGPKSVSLSISEPFWNTLWAYGVYLMIFLGLLYGIFLWVRLRNKLHREEIKYAHEKELYSLKMNFFAKMSHEIQTPLTLILIPLEDMMERAMKSGNVLLQKRLKLISNNTKRLSRIVFELTSVRDRELDKMVLRATENNIIAHLKEITSAFEDQAAFKGITFECDYPGEELIMGYDREKLDHIFFNLLSNAFKFTPRGGTVSLKMVVEDWERNLKISITDSGPGVPKKELENIFKLFYQANAGKQMGGMGIGLALTKELVDLHKGKIVIKSKKEKGTCITVFLPMDLTPLALPSGTPSAVKKEKTLAFSENFATRKEEPNGKLAKTILIVEDNYELQISLKDVFKGYYNVLLAEDGEEGLELATTHKPDLIITDVMMPKMDGISMSIKLQELQGTAHIPIVMLTAKKTSQDKVIGLRTGAIEYIGKPFRINELVLKVNNIIVKRDRIIQKYKNDLITTPKKGEFKSLDEVFLEKLIGIVEEQLGNPDFRMEALAETLNMSYSAVYRKFQALTGKRIVDFVRTMRLKKAAVLIADCNYSVSEAAFLVGFNDPKYFSKCFKIEFGVSPGNFKRNEESNQNTDS